MRNTILLLVALLVGAYGLFGCGGNNDSAALQGVGDPGAIQLLVADAPLDGVAQVNVTITRVDVLFDGRDDSLTIPDPDEEPAAFSRDEVPATPEDPERNDNWITLFRGAKTVDLLALANRTLDELLDEAQLAAVSLPSGHYKQLRLYLDGNSTVVLDDGSERALKVPSNKLRIPMRLFVQPGEVETVLLDFVLPGNLTLNSTAPGRDWYILHPVIRVARMQRDGSVKGMLRLENGDGLLEPVQVEVMLTDAAGNPVPDANGQQIASRVRLSAQEETQARFVLHGVPEGSHTVRITARYQQTEQVMTREVAVRKGQCAELSETVSITIP